MSVIQYIGARYTPEFVGTYDPTQQYDNLQVVDNGSGTSYISKKIVPPGTALTNTEYWALYGASSGAVIDLQGRVGTLETDMTAVKTSILNIGGEVSTNTSDIADIKVKDLSQDDNLYILNNKMKNVIMIGDSWAAWGGTGWFTYLPLMLNYDHLYTASYSGAGFATANSSGKKFIDGLDEVTVPASVDIDTIIVAGGCNDADASNSDITTAISAFITRAETLYPHAKIHIMMINNILGYTVGNKELYVNAYMAFNGYNKKVTVSDLRRNVLISNFTDNTHCNSDGYKQISSAMYADLFGKKYNPGYATKNVTYTHATYGDYTITFNQNGKQIDVTLPSLYKGPVSFSDQVESAIKFTSPDTSVIPCNPKVNIQTQVRLQISGSNLPVIPCEVTITRSYLKFAWVPYNSALGVETYPYIFIRSTHALVGDCW